MMYSPQQVLDRLLELVDEIKLKKNIDAVFYREDYQDYQVILDENYHCEIREKLIDIFFENPKHADTKREITFLMSHPSEYEEWEESPVTSNPDDIVLD